MGKIRHQKKKTKPVEIEEEEVSLIFFGVVFL
jgi:hypothetical protein